MSTHFAIEAWKTHGGTFQRMDGDDARFSVNNAEIFRVLSAIEDRRRRRDEPLFPWYHDAHDFEQGTPAADDGFAPMEVLRSVQSIERELSRAAKKYPSRWLFWQTLPDGTRRSHERLEALYKAKPCRLYFDEKGCWAMVLDSPDKYKPHYDLSDLGTVSVELEGEKVVLELERQSLLDESQNVWNGMRRVCLYAVQENALVLTMILH